MKKYLVVSKGLPQSQAFERAAREYTAKNSLSVEWYFNKEVDYLDVVKTENIDVVVISPEVLITENKIKAELDTINVDYLSVKPADFGLRRLEKIMPLLEAK
ncbi:hypothetical protein [uncultured Clostridium sp.]|jgi:PTS system cellobiose-specific IIB component|uniref:hypothetical protein n=1 Tax=uncultured Clostridium sp. TaxID=59620 RepID=UPI00261F0F0F|nr:hypothetical protein [uncultured Clostridium sp.]